MKQSGEMSFSNRRFGQRAERCCKTGSTSNQINDVNIVFLDDCCLVNIMHQQALPLLHTSVF